MLRAANLGNAPRVLAASAVAASCAADITENTLATITVPAGAMGANGFLRIHTLWSCTNNANGKTVRVRFGGAAGTQYCALPIASNAALSDLRVIANRNSQASQVGTNNATFGGFGANAGGLITSAVDTSVATTIVITGQKAVAGDTLTLDAYLVELVAQG